MKIGAVCQLKCGGPLLVVTNNDGTIPDRLAVNHEETVFTGSVRCGWFNMNGDYNENDFLVDTLNERKMETR